MAGRTKKRRAPAKGTTRTKVEEALFRRAFELAGVGVAHIGLDRRFQHVNRRFCEILGYPEHELLGITGRDLSHPDDKDHMNAQRPRLYAGEIDAARGEKRYLRKDGSVVWVAYTLTVERDRAGKPLYEIAVYDDISARRAMEDALRDSEARFRQVVDCANEGILVYDRSLNIVTANAAAARILDVPAERLAGRPGFTSLFSCVREDGSPMPPDERPSRLTVRRGEPITGLVVGLRRAGEIVWLSVNTAFLRRPGEPGYYGIVSTIRDVTVDAVARERITALAFRDALTGLDNRASLVPALEKAVERTRRRGMRLAGLFLDLDGFKEVNDAHGHDAGDRLLVEAARRLRAALRSADSVARLGGDEFLVVLEDLKERSPAERVAAKLLTALAEPYQLGAGKQASVSASIGISVFPDDAGDAATLIKHADAAMYAAKQAGKNVYRFFVAAPAANDLPDGAAASERGR